LNTHRDSLEFIGPALQTAPLVATLEAPEEIEETKKEKSHSNVLWLALGGSAGNYTPNTSSSNAASSASSFSAGPQNYDAFNKTTSPPKPSPKVGASYSVGVMVGKKFGRIVLQGGINMSRQQISYVSNYDSKTSGVSKAAVSDYLQNNSSAQLSFTNEYTVNSTMEVVSIPVQVGYMIIDRKLGWQFNTGVSPDFFIRNVLVDQSGAHGKFTQEAGSASPYRSVNWSALVNTELSYKIGKQYRISLVPGIRYSFNSILKEPTDNGRPIIFDVGFRFRYMFN
jgi:hypothetical protein